MRSRRSDELIHQVTSRIAAIRKRQGRTQDNVAEALEIATRSYQKMEAGENLTLKTISKIADELGVAPSEFFAEAAPLQRSYPKRVAAPAATLHDSAKRPTTAKRPRRPR